MTKGEKSEEALIVVEIGLQVRFSLIVYRDIL